MSNLITIQEYSVNYNIEPEFLISLEDSGIVIFTLEGDEKYIQEEQLTELERYIHFHYDLNINIEGIDAIRHLLAKVNHMHSEIRELKTRLNLHE
jgi:chaperone modulatory protein CbpM